MRVRLPSFVRDFQSQCHSVPAVAVMSLLVREGDLSADLKHYEEYVQEYRIQFLSTNVLILNCSGGHNQVLTLQSSTPFR